MFLIEICVFGDRKSSPNPREVPQKVDQNSWKRRGGATFATVFVSDFTAIGCPKQPKKLLFSAIHRNPPLTSGLGDRFFAARHRRVFCGLQKKSVFWKNFEIIPMAWQLFGPNGSCFHRDSWFSTNFLAKRAKTHRAHAGFWDRFWVCSPRDSEFSTKKNGQFFEEMPVTWDHFEIFFLSRGWRFFAWMNLISSKQLPLDLARFAISKGSSWGDSLDCQPQS